MNSTVERKIVKWIAIVIYFFIFFMTYHLFYMQATGVYVSDLETHISAALSGTGYSVVSYVYVLLYGISNRIEFIVVLLCIMTLILAFAVGAVIRYFLKKKDIELSWGTVSLLGLSFLFLCQLYIPYIWPHYYFTGVFITQPWHNQTYSFMRLFALLTFAVYLRIEKNYMQTIRWREALVFTLLLSVTNAVKPNFFLFFSLMMLFYLIVDFLQTRGKALIQIIKFGSCVLVSCSVLLWQMFILFPAGGDGGITFRLDELLKFVGSWKNVLGLSVSLIFPVLVFVWSKWRGSDTKILGKVWLMFGIAAIEGFCIYETGPRAAHGNFLWGEYGASWFLFLFSFIKYIELLNQMDRNDKKEKIVCYVSAGLFAAHIVCGLVYFQTLLKGAYFVI